jgi:hypothetical protein
MTLEQAMNNDIDMLIKLLLQAKEQKSYNKKILEMEKLARSCDGYHFYWSEKLNKYLSQ